MSSEKIRQRREQIIFGDTAAVYNNILWIIFLFNENKNKETVYRTNKKNLRILLYIYIINNTNRYLSLHFIGFCLGLSVTRLVTFLRLRSIVYNNNMYDLHNII